MRDTSDMMEDALSEDTMMDCAGDSSGMEDLMDQPEVSNYSPATIRYAAQRLLTILADDEEDSGFVDDDEDSSFEDEWVKGESDEFEDVEEDETNWRLLRQLAASIAQELKYSEERETSNSMMSIEDRDHLENRHQVPSIEMSEEPSYHLQNHPQGQPFSYHNENYVLSKTATKPTHNLLNLDSTMISKDVPISGSSGFACVNDRLSGEESEEVRSFSEDRQVSTSWSAGWDACATEALKYLVEEEGLPPHHPTVVAMKNHLEVQRARAFAQYAV